MSTKIDSPADDITLPALHKGIDSDLAVGLRAYARRAILADRASPSRAAVPAPGDGIIAIGGGPAESVSAHATITKIIDELRTYSPEADEYMGRHILKGWANQLESVAPPHISETDEQYWLRHRSTILAAIENRGFSLVSSGGLFWLSEKGPAPRNENQRTRGHMGSTPDGGIDDHDEPNLPESLTLEVDAWFERNTGLGGCSDKDAAELAAIFYGVTYEGGRESVEDALSVVESFGPGVRGLNDTFARQVLLAAEVRRLQSLYEMAAKGRSEFRAAFSGLRSAANAALAMCERIVDQYDRVQFGVDFGALGGSLRKALGSTVPAAVDVGAAPDTVPLPRKEWEELDYWLGRCESKGHLERCFDLIEPYEALCKAIAASATQQGATP